LIDALAGLKNGDGWALEVWVIAENAGSFLGRVYYDVFFW
jgi:hypothetical protein